MAIGTMEEFGYGLRATLTQSARSAGISADPAAETLIASIPLPPIGVLAMISMMFRIGPFD
jgi:hypothetical protein